jgi:hypothetical protein
VLWALRLENSDAILIKLALLFSTDRCEFINRMIAEPNHFHSLNYCGRTSSKVLWSLASRMPLAMVASGLKIERALE